MSGSWGISLSSVLQCSDQYANSSSVKKPSDLDLLLAAFPAKDSTKNVAEHNIDTERGSLIL